jgi:hypothetical protein
VGLIARIQSLPLFTCREMMCRHLEDKLPGVAYVIGAMDGLG